MARSVDLKEVERKKAALLAKLNSAQARGQEVKSQVRVNKETGKITVVRNFSRVLPVTSKAVTQMTDFSGMQLKTTTTTSTTGTVEIAVETSAMPSSKLFRALSPEQDESDSSQSKNFDQLFSDRRQHK